MVLGQSGSGKSTLLNIIGGMDRPTRGKVTYHEESGKTLSLDKASDSQLTRFRRTYVGFVFQFFNLIPTLTALENVQVATALNDRPGPFNAKSSLEVVGLGQRGDHFPSQLSGGQQQRVAIARAIINKPALLLADEPTGALDSHTTNDVLNLFDELHAQGITIVLVTHEDDVAARAQTVIHFRDGKVERVAQNRDNSVLKTPSPH